MTEDRGNGYHALLCDDCGTEIFVDVNMVMLKDSLWKEIVDEKKEESYCDCCIEKRLNRPIDKADFKEAAAFTLPGFPEGMIPCNAMWLRHKGKL